jgi:hypothetical protein
MSQRRKAYSLIRFGIPQQALGDSARRQYDRAVAFCEAHNIVLVETIRDRRVAPRCSVFLPIPILLNAIDRAGY